MRQGSACRVEGAGVSGGAGNLSDGINDLQADCLFNCIQFQTLLAESL